MQYRQDLKWYVLQKGKCLFGSNNDIIVTFCCIEVLIGTNKKNCSLQTVRINFGVFFMGSVSLTLEAFSRLIWVCLASWYDSMKFLHLLSDEQREMDKEMCCIFPPVWSTQLCLISLKMNVCLWKLRCESGVTNSHYLDHLYVMRKKEEKNLKNRKTPKKPPQKQNHKTYFLILFLL